MLVPSGFQSWKEYFSFALAREYVSVRTGEVFHFERGPFEKVGRSFSAIAMKPLDFFLKEIRNPLMLLSLTVASLFLASILFYPAQTWLITTSILPFLKSVKPFHVRACLYGISQLIILGLGIQGFGRLGNRSLMQAYQNKEIVPIPIGTQRIRV